MINIHMKLSEIILPKHINDHDLSLKSTDRIGLLQKRMDTYVDKLGSPNLSSKDKGLIKSKLKKDYTELRSVLGDLTEDDSPTSTYEVYDTKTGKAVGKPYNSRKRARSRADKLDNIYGAYRYGVRQCPTLTEAVHKLPITDDDFELVKILLNKPIPAIVAPIYINDIIHDDELNDVLAELANTQPNEDIRPFISDWIKRVMPDQLSRFDNSGQTQQQKLGQVSVIHGYDPHMYHGSNEPITGDAFGRY